MSMGWDTNVFDMFLCSQSVMRISGLPIRPHVLNPSLLNGFQWHLALEVCTKGRRANFSLVHRSAMTLHINFKSKFISFVRSGLSYVRSRGRTQNMENINHLTPELNPSAQRCTTRFFTGDFASWTVHFVNICVKNQQIHQLFLQFINYVW
jgi:hypothetical protein